MATTEGPLEHSDVLVRRMLNTIVASLKGHLEMAQLEGDARDACTRGPELTLKMIAHYGRFRANASAKRARSARLGRITGGYRDLALLPRR